MVQCDPGSASRMVDNDCGVHVMVEDVATTRSPKGETVNVKFLVLRATDPGQEGKSFTDYFQAYGGGVDKLYNLAEAVGLITAVQRREAAKQGIGLPIDEAQLKGCQLCAQVKMEPGLSAEKPGPYPHVGFDTFSVRDAKAKDIPKDQEYLAMLAGPQGQGQVAPPQQQQQTPPAAPPATGPVMNW
uniref:Uncharacterized protein n=1 Tax=viral metagenome TaxID=1070528 RepID=A0A6M3KX44_9ZZZZ